MMKRIAITLPYFFEGEAQAIVNLLDSGAFHRVHIRKPEASADEMARLVEAVPRAFRQRLSLHSHPEVAVRLGAGGIHLNSRNRELPQGWTGVVSRSLHTIEELENIDPALDYVFVSPVYPSISKPGYMPAFGIEDLRRYISPRVYALGGVTPDRLPELEAAGFGGAAMLGAVWKAAVDTHKFRLQFISHGPDAAAQLRGVRAVLDGGCRWVQLRMKDASLSETAETGALMAPLCRECGATFIVDDHVELVERIGADGVHLGKNDMPVARARRILGPYKIIGATANTLADIKEAAAAGADYIGLGPFRFTTTKKNLSPVLGLEGYREIIAAARARGIGLPIVAIGGITDADVPALFHAGASGIAVSGSILRAPDPVAETKKLLTPNP